TFLALGEFAAARTTKNEIVFNVPLDHLVWTEPMAKLLTAADARVTQSTRPANKQLWVTGTVSARAKKEIESRGWQVQEQSEERLLSWTEDYPKYEKPEERIPAGFIMLNFKSVGVGVGGSSGDGVLSYQGKDYPFTISGFNVADLGVSRFQGAGQIYQLKVLNDFSSHYSSAHSAFAAGSRRGSGEWRSAQRSGSGVHWRAGVARWEGVDVCAVGGAGGQRGETTG